MLYHSIEFLNRGHAWAIVHSRTGSSRSSPPSARRSPVRTAWNCSISSRRAAAASSIANASAHLQVMRRARLVEAEKQGTYTLYRLAAPEVFTLYRTLRDLG